nr:hypothetical protein [Moraxella equi]
MNNMNKKTTSNIATLASQTLRDPNSSQISKTLAGSALSRSNSNKVTSDNLETKASKVLKSSKFSDNTKSLAGSVLSQSKK